MEGLTIKVFRTFNASRTLQQKLKEFTNPDDTVDEKILYYKKAIRGVAILCNHRCAKPKNSKSTIISLKSEINSKERAIDKARKQNDLTHLQQLEDELQDLKIEIMNEENKKFPTETTEK